jgi:hypothetical protein
MRFARTIAVLALCFAGGLFALWWFSPTLAEALGPRLAASSGIEVKALTIERPTSRRLHVTAATFELADASIRASNVTIALGFDWSPARLVEDILAEQVQITLDTANGPTADDRPTQLDAAEVKNTLETLPKIRIDQLDVRAPDMDFHARGAATLSPAGLAGSLRGLSPARARPFRLVAEVNAVGESKIELYQIAPSNGISDPGVAPTPDRRLIRAAGDLPEDTVAISGDFDLTGFPLELAVELAGLPAGAGRTAGSFELSTPWPIPNRPADSLTTTWPDVDIHANFTADWATTDGQFVLESVAGTIEGNPQELSATLEQGTARIAKPALQVSFPGNTRIRYRDQTVALDGSVPYVLAATDEISAQGVLSRLDAAIEDPVTVNAQSEVTVEGYGYAVPASVTANVNFEGAATNATAQIALGNLQLPISGRFARDGSGNVTGQQRWNLSGPLAAGLVEEWDVPLDFDRGAIDLDFDLRWDADALVGALAVRLEDVGGSYGRDPIRNVAGDLQFTIDSSGVTLEPTQLNVGEIDVGFPIRQLIAKVSADTESVEIADASAEVLGGRITCETLRYDIAKRDTNALFTLNDVDLAEVLALEGTSIAGSGRLNGSLPVQVDGGIVSIKGAAVNSAPGGGKIELSPSLAVPTGQTGLDFAMQALTDFTYETLKATADYADNGDLALAVGLRGSNPTVEKGRSIQYNLTINENLFALMDSLRAQRVITDRVERQVIDKQAN